MWFEVMVVVGLILLNAFFTICDMSIIASKRNRIQSLVTDSSNQVEQLLKHVSDPTKVIATTQIGLTIITLIEGAYVEASVVDHVVQYVTKWGIFVGYENQVSSVGVFVLVTFFLLLFGDILPKRIAILYPEPVAVFLAPITNLVIRILLPIVKSFAFLSDSILRFFGLETVRNDEVSEDDIATMIEAGAQAGVLIPTERDIFENVWRMDESKAGSLMTPRADIVYVDVTESVDENIEKILANPSQNLLICKQDLDNVLGYIPAVNVIKGIVRQIYNKESDIKLNWTEGLKPIHMIPNSLTLIDILESLRKYQTNIALVYNEFGHVEGLITLGDLVAAVIGDIPNVNDDASQLMERDPSGKWLVDGLAPINDLLAELEISNLPTGDTGSYQTAAGFMIALIGRKHGRLPKVFDKFEFANYIFEIVDIDRKGGYRVDKIMVRGVDHVEPEAEHHSHS